MKVESSTIEELHEVITWKIRKIKNVRSTYILKINEEATDCKDDNDEKLYVGTAPDEHVEMYLKAMWLTKKIINQSE